MRSEKEITYPDIYRFWAPLAMMWIVMSLEMPVINSIIARMSFPKENLAIFGVVFSISLIIEGPIIQMFSAATALSTSYGNYKRLSGFLLYTLIFLTSIHFFCSMPQVFSFLAKYILRLDNSFIEPARITFLLMLPWTPAIGYRRMWQGMLIRDGRTYAVTAIMIIRMSATCIVLFAGFLFTDIRGAYVAAISLSIGVISGAVSAGLFASNTIKRMRISQQAGKEIIQWKALLVFYAPLALTSFVIMANRPVISAGITRGLFPLESLAAWPVIISFVFLFQSLPLSFQEAAITLIGGEKNNRKLRHSVVSIGAAGIVLYLAAILTPYGRSFFLKWISGLREELISISTGPLFLLTLVSFASPAISWFRAVNIRRGTTTGIALAVAVNLSVVFLTISTFNIFFRISGLMAAAISYTAAVCAEALYLAFLSRRDKKDVLSSGYTEISS